MTDSAMDLEELRGGVREVLRREAASERLHRFVDADDLHDKALWAEAANLGWPALTVPEAHGGLGLGVREAGLLLEEVGRALAPIPLMGSYLAARAIAACGTAEQQACWLPLIAQGELICAVSPPGPAPRDGLSLTRQDGELVLSGEAGDLLDAGPAGLLVLRAKNDSGGPAYVLVDGAKVKVERTVDRTRHLARIQLDDLRLPADRLLEGGQALDDILAGEAALFVACDAIGGANAIFAQTIEYLKTREQFGKPIGSFQALKHRCADHKVALEASGAVVAEALRLWAAADPQAAIAASSAKAYACEVYAQVAEDAVQLHGGIGFTWEHDAHLFLKRAKLNQALYGSTTAHLDHAANLLLAA